MDAKYMLFIGLIVAFLPALLARRNVKAVAQKEKHDGCDNWMFGPCIPKNRAATCGIGKKLATQTDETCPIKQKQVHCRIPCEAPDSDCKYKKPRNVKSKDMKCDPVTNQYEMTLKLVKGDPSTCAPTKVVSKECRKRQVRAADAKEKRKFGERKQKQATPVPSVASTAAPETSAECKYHKAKGPKPSCDPVTNTRTVVKQLKKSSPGTCEPTKVSTESCHTKKPKMKKVGRKHGGHKNAESKPELN